MLLWRRVFIMKWIKPFSSFPQYQNYNPTGWFRRTQCVKSTDLFYNNEEFYLEGIWLVVPSFAASWHKCDQLLYVLMWGACVPPPHSSCSGSSCISTKPVYSTSSVTWLILIPVRSDMTTRAKLQDYDT